MTARLSFHVIVAWVLTTAPFFDGTTFRIASAIHSRRRTTFVSKHRSFTTIARGGGGTTTKLSSKKSSGAKRSSSKTSSAGTVDADVYTLLAQALQSKLASSDKNGEDRLPDISHVVRAFKSLSSAQKTFKGLDGAAHEAYQRTHSTDAVDISVTGRASRSAARAGAVADGLGACELCELVEFPARFNLTDTVHGTLVGRQVLLNLTDGLTCGGVKLNVLLLFEPDYRGGAGVEHGGVVQEEPSKRANGRLVVVLGDSASRNLQDTVLFLSQSPMHVRLSQGGVALSEVASVHPKLYQAAGSLLTKLESHLRAYNASAIHFVGRSLAGGVASLAATILDGQLVMPADKKSKKKSKTKSTQAKLTVDTSGSHSASEHHSNATELKPLQGLGADRTSAVVLGAPPCLSPNVQCSFVTSLVYGDDFVGRASYETIERFLDRTRRGLKSSGLVSRQVNWMTDALSLATSNLRSHAHGSEGEETRLAVPGRAYLVHPRRLGDSCSMHEIGAQQLIGGREALRAAILWQLNDILLSKSMWKHHQLDSYIHGLDKVHLRGLEEGRQEAL